MRLVLLSYCDKTLNEINTFFSNSYFHIFKIQIYFKNFLNPESIPTNYPSFSWGTPLSSLPFQARTTLTC